MQYEPISPPGGDNSVALGRWVFQELLKITAAFAGVESILLPQLDKEPDKPRNGMIILVDGTNFNPGSGAGFYGRSAGAWVKLG